MKLYPAIDLKAGACVRLKRGDMDSATIYSQDPAAQALAWQAAGFTYLHVVDLDGAFAGTSRNTEAVAAILAAATIPVQLGGGVRDMGAIERWLAAGVARVILGSAALKNPALVRQAARAHPGRIVVGIDARGGMVAVEGWAETSDLPALACAAATSIPVIASGGVGSLADLQALRARADLRIDGVIVGRALYDGRIDPAAAIAALGG
jgi:phosphoribosylformimino-5-aminoimidazole carboxamide ribotide isomerase